MLSHWQKWQHVFHKPFRLPIAWEVESNILSELEMSMPSLVKSLLKVALDCGLWANIKGHDVNHSLALKTLCCNQVKLGILQCILSPHHHIWIQLPLDARVDAVECLWQVGFETPGLPCKVEAPFPAKVVVSKMAPKAKAISKAVAQSKQRKKSRANQQRRLQQRRQPKHEPKQRHHKHQLQHTWHCQQPPTGAARAASHPRDVPTTPPPALPAPQPLAITPQPATSAAAATAIKTEPPEAATTTATAAKGGRPWIGVSRQTHQAGRLTTKVIGRDGTQPNGRFQENRAGRQASLHQQHLARGQAIIQQCGFQREWMVHTSSNSSLWAQERQGLDRALCWQHEFHCWKEEQGRNTRATPRPGTRKQRTARLSTAHVHQWGC